MTRRVDVTTHARFRYLQRIDAEEEYPAGAIRRALERGDRIGGGVVDAVVDEATDATLVYHADERATTVITVLDAAIEYLDGDREVAQ